jgi:hypothetical protein
MSNPTSRASTQHLADPARHEQIRAEWRSASGQVQIAYQSWSQAAGEGTSDAYVAYVAALDQEEAAAFQFQLCVEGLRAPFATLA